jgi:hypothetical protein
LKQVSSIQELFASRSDQTGYSQNQVIGERLLSCDAGGLKGGKGMFSNNVTQALCCCRLIRTLVFTAVICKFANFCPMIGFCGISQKPRLIVGGGEYGFQNCFNNRIGGSIVRLFQEHQTTDRCRSG